MRPLAFALLVAGAVVLAGCTRSVEMTGRVMGTTIRVKAWTTRLSQDDLNKAAIAAIDEARRIDALLTTYDPRSELMRLNAAAHGEWVEVGVETFEVIRRAVEIGTLSDGAFDVTVMPLVDLWGFGPTRRGEIVAPPDEAILAALDTVGFDRIRLDAAGHRVMLPQEGMRVDLGGIAKGYAVDQAVVTLKRHGVTDAIVEIGGDTMAIGHGPGGRLLRVGVQHPTGRGLLTSLEIENRAVATSGDYQNFFVLDGTRYSHLIDPRTGRPIANNVCSVTVVAPDCTTADALATAVSVLGVEKGLEVIGRFRGVEAIIVTRLPDDRIEVHESRRLKGVLRYRR